MALGGRAAEEVIFGKISTGAQNDLERITKLAYSMVTIYGMNEKLGNISFYDSQQPDYAFNKPYSEATAETIDEEVRKLIGQAYEHTKELLTERRNELEVVAKVLLDKEIIFQADLERLIGKRPSGKPTNYEAYTKEEMKETLQDEKKKKNNKDNGNLQENKQEEPSSVENKNN